MLIVFYLAVIIIPSLITAYLFTLPYKLNTEKQSSIRRLKFQLITPGSEKKICIKTKVDCK